MDPVAAQYERFPYPARDPAEEARRLVTGSPSRLAEIDHYLFGGARDWRRPFRALVAGGGTGDATVMLAQQLADRGAREAEVVYLDLSKSARHIAEARVAARRLKNVRFVSGSLLDLPGLGLSGFDYIDCCGVLHHLEDPAAGLAALKAALAPEGGVGIMLYGPYGRTGVYPLQAALRQLGHGQPLEAQLQLARGLLSQLPATNWFPRNPFLGDHRRSDAELVDLLLHPRDRAFAVPDLGTLIAGAGLELAAFIEPLRYDPAIYLRDPELARRAAALPFLERAALAERLAGNMKLHVAYLAQRAGTVSSLQGAGTVPQLVEWEGPKVAAAVARDGALKGTFDGFAISLPLPREAAPLIARLDGRTSLGALERQLAAAGGPSGPAFERLFAEVLRVLGGVNRLLLRNPPPAERTSDGNGGGL